MNRELKAEIIKLYGSQFSFAQRVKQHESTISKILHGRMDLDDKSQEIWSEALGGINVGKYLKQSE